MADFKSRKRGKSHVQNMGIFFGGSGHGSESSCQISAYYKFFSGLHVFCRISTGLGLLVTFNCSATWESLARSSPKIPIKYPSLKVGRRYGSQDTYGSHHLISA